MVKGPPEASSRGKYSNMTSWQDAEDMWRHSSPPPGCITAEQLFLLLQCWGQSQKPKVLQCLHVITAAEMSTQSLSDSFGSWLLLFLARDWSRTGFLQAEWNAWEQTLLFNKSQPATSSLIRKEHRSCIYPWDGQVRHELLEGPRLLCLLLVVQRDLLAELPGVRATCARGAGHRVGRASTTSAARGKWKTVLGGRGGEGVYFSTSPCEPIGELTRAHLRLSSVDSEPNWAGCAVTTVKSWTRS